MVRDMIYVAERGVFSSAGVQGIVEARGRFAAAWCITLLSENIPAIDGLGFPPKAV
jgi:hypothetical protein